MVMSQDQIAGRIFNKKIDNSSFKRVELFKYLGKLMNLNTILEEIKSRMKSRMLLSFSAQSFV
jgi:division protein CdvB (Snf7/Vps24/ESCRT-III family)